MDIEKKSLINNVTDNQIDKALIPINYYAILKENVTCETDKNLKEKIAFMNDLRMYYLNNNMSYKLSLIDDQPIQYYKLWDIVLCLGGYEKVTKFNLWYKVGEVLDQQPENCAVPPHTIFRYIYEKILLEFDMHNISSGYIQVPSLDETSWINIKKTNSKKLESKSFKKKVTAISKVDSQDSLATSNHGRIKRKAAVCAREIWQTSLELNSGLYIKNEPLDLYGNQLEEMRDRMIIYDVGRPQANWIKISALETDKCYEVYALIPGFLPDELRIQIDSIGRLGITGNPKKPDNLWGCTCFEKVLILPKKTDPLGTKATVLLNGRVVITVPFDSC